MSDSPLNAEHDATRLPVADAVLCQQLVEFMRSNIPLAEAMQFDLQPQHNDGTLIMVAPLQPNINDKGSAFGGSISSLMTLAGWSWLWLANTALEFSREIVIGRCETRFRLPVKQQLQIQCDPPDQSQWQAYLHSMQQKARGRLALRCRLLLDDGREAATMQADYVTLKVEQ